MVGIPRNNHAMAARMKLKKIPSKGLTQDQIATLAA